MPALQHVKQLFKPHFVTPLLFGLILLLTLLRCLFTLDPDFGWHIASGQYILLNGVPQTDIYTYTAPNFPWIHHEWLADVINAVIFKIGNLPLVALFYTALWTLAIGLAAGKKHNYKSALAVLITVLAASQFIAIRDTAWTVLLLVITSRIFTKYRAYLPLLFIAWANLHGGFVIGLVYLGWRLVYEQNWRDSWIVPAAIAGTFVNPYGMSLYTEIFATVFDTTLHTKINEWQRWAIDGSMIVLPLIWIIPIAYDLYKKRWRGIVQFDAILLAASLLSLRHFILFALFALPRIVKFYSQLSVPLRLMPKNVFSPRFIMRSIGLQTVGYTILVLAIAASVVALQQPLKLNPENNEPTAAINSLRVLPCKGNLFNHYDIGGYLIWKYPEQKVYIDGRMPSWQYNGTNYMDDYLKITKDESFQKNEFNKYHITCAILHTSNSLAQSLQKQGWKAETDNASGWVLLRR